MCNKVKFVLELRTLHVSSSVSLRPDRMEHLAGNWSWWVTGKPTVRGLGVRLHQHYVHQSENS